MGKIDFNYVNNLAFRDTDINEHLLDLYGVAVGMNAKVIVELGAGQSTYALTAAANETKGQLYSVDLGKDAVTRLFPQGEGVLDKEERYHFIQGDDMEIVKTWNTPIDFLFLDTSHLYEDTKKEIEAWFPKVKKGGIIAMHDVAHEEGLGTGCRKALDEFMKSEEGKDYRVLQLLDTKHLGMAILIKLL